MTDASETDRLVNTDVSKLTPTELKAHLEEVERRMKDLLRTERDLLEASSEVLSDHPALQARLTELRTTPLD
ncbi:hypothetical protein EV645_5008 [Kribbella rubisoli]|uniref:Uncharacterized protein n=1 Tax=Kribbella rubisoli TaxID=3075929 RepID=A0A4Q7WUP6_9ACTN|nr:hypothetical protein [Kribbella rubisoli]RZU14144.1 hypothetical protein EV645_5008 [Kribbella rubisoli]